MDSLPDAIVHYILSHMNNARDVAISSCVSKRWKESMPYIRSLYFPRNSLDNNNGEDSDIIVGRMISSIVRLEELVVYCPFSSAGLAAWLSRTSHSLRQLELRMDNLTEKQARLEGPSKMDCIDSARNLESLRLWGVLMTQPPKWRGFKNLHTLAICGARLKDNALSGAIKACPNLIHLSLLGCDGLRSVTIELQHLRECRLDFYGMGNCFLTLSCPNLQMLDVQGCSWIRATQTNCLTNLSISNSAGRVYKVDFGKLGVLESLSIKGVQWCWDAITTILQCASEVKHLFMKVEFTGDFDTLQPFPEVDLVEFFNSHPKLQTFEMHGAMFAAFCQKNSLKSVDSRFAIPYLEDVIITVRSPLNAEQKITTLESLVKHGNNLKRMVIKILQMKNCHSSADDFFEEICRFRYLNHKIVRIE
ncbi:F-box protein At1g10780 [Macadamia integrifolia]|uniref:F-box protein At1g10780 n=1 Tax=Macadamia integrifolia TaxID=60698 RepID=UPI001C4E7B86|nr:F-box protein At1g10780 [Macadamia integrifolia]